MLLILFVVAIVGTRKLSKTDYYRRSDLDIAIFIGNVVIGFAVFSTVLVMIMCSSGSIEVKLYEQENEKIEKKIDLLTKRYIDHESDFYKNFKKGDGVALVETYPELKGNELISTQLKIYERNNNKLLEAKKDEIYCNTAKWWLYFGGKR